MLTQVGSQRNKLRDADISLRSMVPALKSLEWDAVDLTLMNNDQLTAPDSCQTHEQETAEGLEAIKDGVEDVKETLNRIEGFVHPCGGVGWTRVVKVDYTDPSVDCPGDSQKDIYESGGCSSGQSEAVTFILLTYPVNGQLYNEVCGKVSAFSVNVPEAFLASAGGDTTIDDAYVDGISLTHGSSPRTHIWTFAAADAEDPTATASVVLRTQCPCDGGTPAPDFVQGDYFCEAGVEESTEDGLNGDDVLWDGEDCTTELCCTLNTPPYFYSFLDTPTTDDIDARVMVSSSSLSYDNIVLTAVELYIRYTEPPE